MTINLHVEYNHREEAKRAGCFWDKINKLWAFSGGRLANSQCRGILARFDVVLSVPFHDKERAKRLGAMWHKRNTHRLGYWSGRANDFANGGRDYLPSNLTSLLDSLDEHKGVGVATNAGASKPVNEGEFTFDEKQNTPKKRVQEATGAQKLISWTEDEPPSAVDTANPQCKRKRTSTVDREYCAGQQNNLCAYCGTLLPPCFQIDHIVALSLGGSNQRSNLQAVCANCHAIKTHIESSLRSMTRHHVKMARATSS